MFFVVILFIFQGDAVYFFIKTKKLNTDFVFNICLVNDKFENHKFEIKMKTILSLLKYDYSVGDNLFKVTS